jgi:hypothetical protein
MTNSLSILQDKTKLSKKDSFGLFIIGTLALQIVSLFCLILLYGSYRKLETKPPPSLVQLATGESISVSPLGSKERTPEVIKTFTTNTLTTMMNWTGYLPASTPEEATRPVLDKGIEIEVTSGLSQAKKGKITTAAYEGSFALSEDFRKDFLAKLVELTPSTIFRGNTDVVLVPLSVSEPEQVEVGKWKLILIANLMVFENGNNVGNVIPFNKEVFVQSVEVPDYLLKSDAGKMAQIIAKVRASGLEIYGLRDFQQRNLY